MVVINLYSLISLISFFNYYFEMVILVVYLILDSFVLLFVFIHLCYLFHWVYFTSFFDHYIEQNICFHSFSATESHLQNSCS